MADTMFVAVDDALRALPMAVVLVGGDGRIGAWNTAAEVLYGHPSDRVLGKPAVEILFDDDDRDAAIAKIAAAQAGTAWEGDCRVRRSDGALLVSSFRLVPIGTTSVSAWVATDGTDQGLAEQERAVLLSAEHAARSTAEEALALVETILSSAPVGIAVFDLDLRYVRVNDAYAALTGVPAADHAGTLVGDAESFDLDVVADLRRVVTTGRTILGRHLEIGGDDDPAGNRHFNVSYFPVRNAAGTLVGAGFTMMEITESKRAEAERAALLLRAEVAHQRLSILATASTVLTTTMELDELLARLTRVLTPAAADWCVIALVGERGAVEHVAASHRDRRLADDVARALRFTPVDLQGAAPVAEVLRTGRARVNPPCSIGELWTVGTPAEEGLLQSSVLVPIEARGRVLGALLLGNDRTQHLDDDNFDLAVEIAHRAALAVWNARAFQQEHRIAESLQRALLPAIVPSVPGLDLAVRYVVATDGASVGGDWYDVLAFDDGTTGLVVGDVVGHDIGASTLMGQLRSALRAYAHEDHAAPSSAFRRIERRFDSLGLTYATCVFGVVDLATGTFRWSNAGHPPPLRLRDGRAAFLSEGAGVLLGVSPGADIPEAATDLREGDVLILYTDGLVERRGASLQNGLDRLAAAAAVAANADAGAICDALLSALLPTGGTRDDDVAILVARVRPAAADGLVHRLPFDAKPESATLTRGYTEGLLRGAGWGEQADTAVLLVSELVTNAVRHARGPCELVITFRDDEVELAVKDGDPRLPAARQAELLDDSGRGFLLVEAMAARWGVRPLPGGKATWFTLRA